MQMTSTYHQFLSGALPLSAPVFTTVAENVSRFLVSNGVVAEGASRDQFRDAFSRAPQSLFHRIRRRDETLPQLALRFRRCLSGAGLTPQIQIMRKQLEDGYLLSSSVVANLVFDGGLKTFDDARERAQALLSQIEDFRNKPAKEGNAALHRLARNLPRAGLGEYAAEVWLALIKEMERAPAARVQWSRLIAQTGLGMGGAKVIRALCALIDRKARSSDRFDSLVDVAIAANRLGWPQIAEAILEEARPLNYHTYWVFRNLLEEMDDPDRMIRIYLKWLPEKPDWLTYPSCGRAVLESLARSGLGSRVREVADPLIGLALDRFKDSQHPWLRFQLATGMSLGLRKIGFSSESESFLKLAINEFKRADDGTQKDMALDWLERKGLRERFVETAVPVKDEKKERLKAILKQTLSRPKPKRDLDLISEYLSALPDISDPWDRALLYADLGHAIGSMASWYRGKHLRHHLDLFFMAYLGGMPHTPFRTLALQKAAQVLNALPIDHGMKKGYFFTLLAVSKGISSTNRGAEAIRGIADAIADRSQEPIHKRLYGTPPLSKEEVLELLQLCMTAAAALPADHPATNYTIRHVGRHLARYGMQSGYPREAFTAEDREFMEDPK